MKGYTFYLEHASPSDKRKGKNTGHPYDNRSFYMVSDGNYVYEFHNGLLYSLNFDRSRAYEIAEVSDYEKEELDNGLPVVVKTYGTFGVMSLEIKKA